MQLFDYGSFMGKIKKKITQFKEINFGGFIFNKDERRGFATSSFMITLSLEYSRKFSFLEHSEVFMVAAS